MRFRRLAALAVLTLAAVALPARAVPVPFASNVEFLANVADPGAIGGRFFTKGGTPYFLTTGPSGLRIYDASIPELPALAGALPLPHWENEDVDLSVARGIALISVDGIARASGLFVIDISNVNMPRVASFVAYPPRLDGNTAPGHTVSCIYDCRAAWVAGATGGTILTINLSNIAAPVVGPTIVPGAAGTGNGAFRSGTIHDVTVDSIDGRVWVSGSGGITAYAPITSIAAALAPTRVLNQPIASTFIIHNSLRPSATTLLVTEEDWVHETEGCSGQGRFLVYSGANGSSLSHVRTFRAPTFYGSYTNGSSQTQELCSSHWFDWRSDGLLAIGWYMQGVRFVSGWGQTETGWWTPPGGVPWASYFHPVNRSVVYVLDATRGLDVLRYGASPPLVAAGMARVRHPDAAIRFAPHPQFGWACALPVPA